MRRPRPNDSQSFNNIDIRTTPFAQSCLLPREFALKCLVLFRFTLGSGGNGVVAVVVVVRSVSLLLLLLLSVHYSQLSLPAPGQLLAQGDSRVVLPVPKRPLFANPVLTYHLCCVSCQLSPRKV